MTEHKPELGQINFDAFNEVMEPPYKVDWQDLTSLEQEAWQRAAKAVVTYTSQ
jgi:hypothetical protein